MANMESIKTLAISKVIKDKAQKEARNQVGPGTYHVDCTVRVSGEIKVGEDYTQQIVAKADPWSLLAVAMDKLNGVTLESIVAEATGEGVDTADLKERVADAMKEIKGETETECKGKVTTKLEVEELAVV